MINFWDRRCFSAIFDHLIQALLSEMLRVLLNNGLETDYSWRLLGSGLLFHIDGRVTNAFLH